MPHLAEGQHAFSMTWAGIDTNTLKVGVLLLGGLARRLGAPRVSLLLIHGVVFWHGAERGYICRNPAPATSAAALGPFWEMGLYTAIGVIVGALVAGFQRRGESVPIPAGVVFSMLLILWVGFFCGFALTRG